jgi:hypothetical protein
VAAITIGVKKEAQMNIKQQLELSVKLAYLEDDVDAIGADGVLYAWKKIDDAGTIESYEPIAETIWHDLGATQSGRSTARPTTWKSTSKRPSPSSNRPRGANGMGSSRAGLRRHDDTSASASRGPSAATGGRGVGRTQPPRLVLPAWLADHLLRLRRRLGPTLVDLPR